MSSNILFVPVLLPMAIGIVALLIPGRIKWVREILALAVSALVFACSLWILFREAPAISIPLFEIGRFSLSFDLVLTPLSAFVLVFIAGFCFLICLYSLLHMQLGGHSKAFFAFLLIALAGSAGVVLADHLLIFLVFNFALGLVERFFLLPHLKRL